MIKLISFLGDNIKIYFHNNFDGSKKLKVITKDLYYAT